MMSFTSMSGELTLVSETDTEFQKKILPSPKNSSQPIFNSDLKSNLQESTQQRSKAILKKSGKKSAQTLFSIIQQIESLKNKELLTAIELASIFDESIDQYSLTEQIRFKVLQAELYHYKATYSLADQAANKGLVLTKKLTHPSINMAKLLNLRGRAVENIGEYQSALRDYIAALEIAESLGDRKTVIETLLNIGSVYCNTEQLERSLIILNDALAQAQALDDNKLLGLAYLKMGSLYKYLQQNDKVKEFNDAALLHLTKANEPHWVLMVLQQIAQDHANKKAYPKAIQLYKKITEQAKSAGNTVLLANTYTEMAKVYLKQQPSDPQTAYRYLTIANRYLPPLTQVNENIIFLVNKAEILTHLSRYHEAQSTIKQSEELILLQLQPKQTYSGLELLRIKSELYYAQGLYEQAYLTQNQHHEGIKTQHSQNNLQAFEAIRIKHESKQHLNKTKILEKKQAEQSFALLAANKAYRNNTLYISGGILVVVILAWFYVVNLKNQQRLLNSREIDYLTRLPNRQKILLLGNTLFNQSNATKAKLFSSHNGYSTLLIKIDNLANINQIKGYDVGSQILIEISLIIKNSIIEHGSQHSLCGRYSKNEFIVFLPNTTTDHAKEIANKIHHNIYKNAWHTLGVKVVSVSIGISNSTSGDVDSFESLVKKARILENKAIDLGGNNVCV